jgi:GntR family transcriptional regulator/MocR family aminotransferase
MRKAYRATRNRVVKVLENCPFSEKITILEQDAGLHFLLKIDTALTDRELTDTLRASGIRVHALSHYYHEIEENTRILVINYVSVGEEELAAILVDLAEKFSN